MNIFYLDQNPFEAARMHSDKHVVKMILESAQILMCNYHKANGFTKKKEFTDQYITDHFSDFPRRTETGEPSPYGMTHPNHPSTVWARESLSNFMYTLRLGQELCKEYTRRYNKHHAAEPILDWIENKVPMIIKYFDKIEMTEPALAIAEQLLDPTEVNRLLESINVKPTTNKAVNAYRAYYIFHKKDINKWAHSNKPSWYPAIELINNEIENVL